MDPISSEPKPHQDLNLKATELRLGLPGSESPERNTNNINNNIGIKILVAGAKRGFSDTINNNINSGTWGFKNSNCGKDCEGNFGKNGGFLGENSNNNNNHKNPCSVVKDSGGSASSPKHANHPQVNVAASKAQVVGWPPIRSFRKNSMAAKNTKNEDDANAETGSCVYVKVSMDGAPYLRKVDLKMYSSYLDLSSALEKMFSSFTLGQHGTHGSSESPLMDLLKGSEYVLTYEDKDGDLMLVGDVPWDMFTGSCKRMRIMKSSDAIGLAPRVTEKYTTRS
ncbi:auxin-responsive protein IAA14-like [Bidens hawaiensis]|uniref:auxin-responsive protein IAA14-like n=1 Tax=Bidens hawaiensis TaxID=980011 RepID=UPI00404998CA